MYHETQTVVTRRAMPPYLAWGLCGGAGVHRASALGVGGPSGASVCCSGPLVSLPPGPGTENQTGVVSVTWSNQPPNLSGGGGAYRRCWDNFDDVGGDS